MIFYHYTTRYAVEGIRTAGVLKTTMPNPSFVPPWLSITTDLDSQGHGLPDGRPLGPGDNPNLAAQVIDGVSYCFDHTECRVVLDLDVSSSDLVRVIKHHSVRELYHLNISAHFPTKGAITEQEMNKTIANFACGYLVPKANTWWYWKKQVPLQDIVRFEIRDAAGVYVPMP